MVRSSIGASRWQHDVEQRAAKRLPIAVPAQMVWRDDRGATHLADAETKDVSKSGVFVRCLGGSAIPLYRLVNLQIARAARGSQRPPPRPPAATGPRSHLPDRSLRTIDRSARQLRAAANGQAR